MYREAEKAMQEELKNKIFDVEEEVAATSEQERIAEDEADEVIAANYDEYMTHKRRDDQFIERLQEQFPEVDARDMVDMGPMADAPSITETFPD